MNSIVNGPPRCSLPLNASSALMADSIVANWMKQNVFLIEIFNT